MIHVGGTLYVISRQQYENTWIILNVEFIRTCILICLFDVSIQGRIKTNAPFFRCYRYIGNTSGGRTLVKPMQPHDAPNPLVRSHTSSIEGITCSADGKHGTRWYTVVVVHRGGGTSWWYSCNLGY
jgi:hypothetical protein